MVGWGVVLELISTKIHPTMEEGEHGDDGGAAASL